MPFRLKQHTKEATKDVRIELPVSLIQELETLGKEAEGLSFAEVIRQALDYAVRGSGIRKRSKKRKASSENVKHHDH